MNIEENLTEEQVYNFIRDNKPSGMQLVAWADECGLNVGSLSKLVEGLVKSGMLKQVVSNGGYAISYEVTKKVKVQFGLEAQGHIKTIESIIERWNKVSKENSPDKKPINMMYSKAVWEEIGKIIGWCPFTASLKYFKYLENKSNDKSNI